MNFRYHHQQVEREKKIFKISKFDENLSQGEKKIGNINVFAFLFISFCIAFCQKLHISGDELL